MKKGLFFAALMLLVAFLAACTPETITETVEVTREVVVVETVVSDSGEVVEVTRVETVVESVEVVVTATPDPTADMEPEMPVTMNINWGAEPPSADPSLATDTTSVDMVANLFVGLTIFDPANGEVTPYLAESWDISDDGTVYTFHLRNDIVWVNYDPATGETTVETDDNGNERIVNANDVVYGIKRTIDPVTASDYSYVLYFIKNAAPINGGEEGFTVDDLGVVALDDWTVEITLEAPAAFFPAIAGLWVAKPQPSWAIDAWGDKWTEAGLIVTNGPYMMEEWIHGSELNLIKNPYWVNADDVQIERIQGVMVVEASTAFAMYENNELDTTAVPQPEIDRVKADAVLSAEYVQQPQPCTYYYGFVNNKPPFDDVNVRRAFVLSIDRQSLIDNVTKGGQLPATTFAPPGIFGAVPPSEGIGLAYDPEAAVASLQTYLDEQGMTLEEFNAMDIVLMHNTSEGHARIAAAIQQMWKDVLGVDVRVENQEWRVYLDTIRKGTPIEEAPHIWRLGWCADYADQNNWVHEVFNSEAGANSFRRNCLDATCTEVTTTEFDHLTTEAGLESDPAIRAELYRQAEQILSEIEVAYAPIYFYTTNTVTKPWLTRNYPPLGGNDFFNWSIDWEAKQAAQGN